MARKLLSLVVALSVVLSSMSFAFAAADPEKVSADVSDAKVKAAVQKLVALGMVEGYEDGTYRPAEKLTRSQMTKLIVVALGLGPAADAAMGSTSFSDVAADHWASGFINVAAGQGLVQGMGDGTFAPESEVTYAQALTMLVRALGYKDEFLKGTWPGNYLAKAAEKGLTSGITVVPGSAADRAAFALMMSNTLDAKVVKVESYDGDTTKYYEDQNKTLLKEKMKLDKAEVRITGNARTKTTKSDELQATLTKAYTSAEMEIKFDSLSIGGIATLKASSVDQDKFLGVKSNIYVKDKDTIVYIEGTGDSEVVWDGVDKWTSYSTTAAPTDIKLRWSGRQIPVKGADISSVTAPADTDIAKIYLTNDASTDVKRPGPNQYFSASAVGILGELYGKWVIESGKIVFADLYNYESTRKNLLVKSVDATNNTVTYIDSTGNESVLNLSSSYGGVKVFAQDGSALKLSDLKAFDVICISKSKIDSKEIANIFVFRNTKTGTITAVSSDALYDSANSKMTGKIELDGGVGFTDIAPYQFTYSKDSNATYKYQPSNDQLNDFYDAKVTLIIDNNKKIRHLYGETESSSTLYAIIKDMDEKTVSQNIKLYLASDETVTYQFEDSDKIFEGSSASKQYEALLGQFAPSGDDYLVLMKYKLTKDGKIAKNSVTTYPVNSANLTVKQSFGESTLSAGSTAYSVETDVKIFDAFNAVNATTYVVDDIAKLNVASWANLKGKEITSDAKIFYVTDGQNTSKIQAMVILSNLGSLTSDVRAAYLVNTLTIDGDPYGWFKVYGETELKRYEIDVNDLGQTKEAAAIISVGAGGKVKILKDGYAARTGVYNKNFSTIAGRVYAVDGSSLTVKDGVGNAYRVTVASDAVVYIGDGAKSFSNVNVNDIIVGVLKDGVVQAMELQNVKQYVTVAAYDAKDAWPAGYNIVGNDKKIVAVSTSAGVEGYYVTDAKTGSTATVNNVSVTYGQPSFYVNSDGKVNGILFIPVLAQ